MFHSSIHSTPIYDEMLLRLSIARSRLYKERILRGGVISATAIVVLVTLSSIVEALFNSGVGFRTFYFGLAALSLQCLVHCRAGVALEKNTAGYFGEGNCRARG
jgi:hypothetical protein